MKEDSHLLERTLYEENSKTEGFIPTRQFSLIVVSTVIVFLLCGIGANTIGMILHNGRTIPFESVIHPMQPSSYWGSVTKPYSTGAFWTNLVIENEVG